MDRIVSKYTELKQGHAQALMLKQVQFERDTWRRMLELTIEESISLKNRLTEILSNDFDPVLLDDLEVFQSRFIARDQLTSLLRHDLAELDKLNPEGVDPASIDWIQIRTKLKVLRNNMMTAQLQFNKLTFDFNNYLLENL
jgi:hypothetical protein